MKPISFNTESSSQVSRSASSAKRENQAVAINKTALVTRLLYAVIIVGFLGYYLEKSMQIIRQ